MTQSHQGTLPISDMPPAAKTLKIYAEHSYKPLLSLGQLADSGYISQGDSRLILLTHPDYKPLLAIRESASGMYLLNLKQPHPPSKFQHSPDHPISLNFFANLTPLPRLPDFVNNAHSMTTKSDLAIYYRHALFSPVFATLIKATSE